GDAALDAGEEPAAQLARGAGLPKQPEGGEALHVDLYRGRRRRYERRAAAHRAAAQPYARAKTVSLQHRRPHSGSRMACRAAAAPSLLATAESWFSSQYSFRTASPSVLPA